jgi:hypothetical protein
MFIYSLFNKVSVPQIIYRVTVSEYLTEERWEKTAMASFRIYLYLCLEKLRENAKKNPRIAGLPKILTRDILDIKLGC